MTDTIYALSSAPGRAGVAVIRVSGPQAWDSAKILSGKNNFTPRVSQLASLKDIDRALILSFKAPASFTGEDVIEYHVHGGRAVIDSLMAALAKQKNHRMADPGEFTRRAFENGKLDLTAAEAVADLINAETQAQKIQAFAQMEGSLSRLYEGWTNDLKKSLAHLEADIEFPDEDLPGGISSQMKPVLEKLAHEISAHLNDNRRGERLRNGMRIAVIGAPNAGKSSLVNALAQRDIAIVSDLPGTTRDIIEAHLDLGGYPVILSDTAGLNPRLLQKDGHDSIESEGIRRALKLAQDADLKILLFDASDKSPDAATLALKDENAIMVMNKSDLKKSSGDMIAISVQTGAGLDRLLITLTAKIKTLAGNPETPSLTRARHRNFLEETQTSLTRAQTAKLPELMAEDMRLGIRSLGRITGRVDVEDLLDVIFRDFCIGK